MKANYIHKNCLDLTRMTPEEIAAAQRTEPAMFYGEIEDKLREGKDSRLTKDQSAAEQSNN